MVIADSATTLIILISENEQVSPAAATEQLYCEVKLWESELPHNEQKKAKNINVQQHSCGQFFGDNNCNLGFYLI